MSRGLEGVEDSSVLQWNPNGTPAPGTPTPWNLKPHFGPPAETQRWLPTSLCETHRKTRDLNDIVSGRGGGGWFVRGGEERERLVQGISGFQFGRGGDSKSVLDSTLQKVFFSMRWCFRSRFLVLEVQSG